MTNKCTIISQIITLLHVSTLSCHPQAACNQYLVITPIQKVALSVKSTDETNNELVLFQYLYCVSSIILYNDQQMHTIISQIITLLHVSTLSYHPQTACNQYLYHASSIILYNEPTNVQLFHKLSHCCMFRHCRVILRQPVINTCTVHLLSFCTMNQQMHTIFHKLPHRYMFRHCRVILRQPAINTLPSYTSISNPAVSNTIYN